MQTAAGKRLFADCTFDINSPLYLDQGAKDGWYALTELSSAGNLAQLFSPHSSEFLSDLEKFDNTIVKLG
ncbi:hypothetical protein CVT26_011851 [Gymnopilus dilepis]|uniref:Uncharacterized protein n=1 Tax=Gymnopilus dilepis TaxID=231916 RepID=A0A409WK92_9AGAR|nr:hypothetical protein CVT26_011851 [Gymnopilus dilepis]